MQRIPHQGSKKFTIPAAESIAVYTEGIAKVYREIGYPNVPATKSLLGTVQGSSTQASAQTVFGAYASGATIVVESINGEVFCEVGVAPLAQRVARTNSQTQPTPTAKTTAVTLTAAELLTKIVTGTHAAGATQAYTLPTGANMDLAAEFAADDSFDWVLINLSAAAADTVTLTAATGHTIVGNPIVQSSHSTTGGIYGNSAQFRTRKTAADTFVTYRIG